MFATATFATRNSPPAVPLEILTQLKPCSNLCSLRAKAKSRPVRNKLPWEHRKLWSRTKVVPKERKWTRTKTALSGMPLRSCLCCHVFWLRQSWSKFRPELPNTSLRKGFNFCSFFLCTCSHGHVHPQISLNKQCFHICACCLQFLQLSFMLDYNCWPGSTRALCVHCHYKVQGVWEKCLSEQFCALQIRKIICMASYFCGTLFKSVQIASPTAMGGAEPAVEDALSVFLEQTST